MHPWQKAGVRPEDAVSVLAHLRVFPEGAIGNEGQLLGYVFITDQKYDDRKLRLPGGGKDPQETPREAVARELREETGLVVAPSAFRFVDAVLSPGAGVHWSCLFTADIDTREVAWMNSQHAKNEGEVPHFLRLNEYAAAAAAGKILEPHLTRLVARRLVRTHI